MGEELRVSVVIQMPKEERERRDEEGGEDEVGWENGMELGVWEGFVGGIENKNGSHRDRYSRAAWRTQDEGVD